MGGPSPSPPRFSRGGGGGSRFPNGVDLAVVATSPQGAILDGELETDIAGPQNRTAPGSIYNLES